MISFVRKTRVKLLIFASISLWGSSGVGAEAKPSSHDDGITYKEFKALFDKEYKGRRVDAVGEKIYNRLSDRGKKFKQLITDQSKEVGELKGYEDLVNVMIGIGTPMHYIVNSFCARGCDASCLLHKNSRDKLAWAFESGADLNAENALGVNVLWMAAAYNNRFAVEELLARNCDITDGARLQAASLSITARIKDAEEQRHRRWQGDGGSVSREDWLRAAVGIANGAAVPKRDSVVGPVLAEKLE